MVTRPSRSRDAAADVATTATTDASGPTHDAAPGTPDTMNGAVDAMNSTADGALRFDAAVTAAGRGARLDRFLAERLKDEGVSRERVKALIREGRVTVDGVAECSPKTQLRAGATVSLNAAPLSSPLAAESGELEILYRDAVLAVINKPAGLTTHPAPGLRTGTLVHRLLAHFPELAGQPGDRPGIAHRLDKDTSGLMLVALTEECRLALAEMFARHTVHKEYLALVGGVPGEPEGIIDAPVGRHPSLKTRMAVTPGGKEAKSAWRTLHADPGGAFSLVAVRIFSGRTHQVRVHMRHIGHPLLGDAVYGGKGGSRAPAQAPHAPRAVIAPDAAASGVPDAAPRASSMPDAAPRRQMLHAWKLSLAHPLPDKAGPALTGKLAHTDGDDGPVLEFCCPPPGDFFDAASALCRRPLRAVVTGSPGCGKSALLSRIRDRGVPTFSADACVAALYLPGGDGRHLLAARYGERFVPGPKEPVNKAALGAAMREDDALRREVEAMLHPLVFAALQDFWREHAGADLAVAEIPLYLECGRDKTAPPLERPVLIGVHCPFAIRRERLADNRGWDRETIARVESWQWPEDRKMAACDIVVDNTGSLDDLDAATRTLLRDLDRLRQRRNDEAAAALAACWRCP